MPLYLSKPEKLKSFQSMMEILKHPKLSAETNLSRVREGRSYTFRDCLKFMIFESSTIIAENSSLWKLSLYWLIWSKHRSELNDENVNIIWSMSITLKILCTLCNRIFHYHKYALEHAFLFFHRNLGQNFSETLFLLPTFFSAGENIGYGFLGLCKHGGWPLGLI